MSNNFDLPPPIRRDNSESRFMPVERKDAAHNPQKQKPSQTRKSEKDFKEVLASKKEHAVEKNVDNEEAETTPSLFDLSSGANQGGAPNAVPKESTIPNSPFASMTQEAVKNSKSRDQMFSDDQRDQKAIPQPIAAFSINNNAKAEEIVTIPKPDFRNLLSQLVDNIYTMKLRGQTDTVLTLKNPPAFAGAQVSITSFAHARGEFNITFSNLTQAAKNLLDLANNQEALQKALKESGYVAHIIVTTTLETDNSRRYPSGSNFQQGGQDERQDKDPDKHPNN